ncbi:MAG: hypothetical protein ABJ004_12595 [Cyclobacteriaceae bacterium]
MMKRTLAIIIILMSISASGQKFSSEVWHKGFIVTVDQDTVRGNVRYDMETNIVLVSRNGVVQTFTSQKLFYVEIFDSLVETYRQFYSIPYNVKYDYQVPILFEVLYEAPLSLLSRESIVTETVNSSVYGTSFLQTVVRNTFYFLDKQGTMKVFSGRKQDLLTIMARKQGQIKDFIKQNKLNTDDVRDLIRVTAFYNSL